MKQTQKSIMAVCLSALTIFGTSGINAQTPQALQSLSGNKSANKATEQEAQYIYTAGEFLSYIAQSGNNGEEYFKLATDIDICEALTDIASHLSIPYGVTLDGNGHTLTCKPIKGPYGTFAVISSNYGTIKNLKVVSNTNSEDFASIQATELPASSFIMENGGNLENCCFETELNVTDYSGTPFGKYGAVINSLTGGSITNCHIKTTILGGSSIDKLFATSGSAFINTISGNGRQIENCIVEAFGINSSAAAFGGSSAMKTYSFACTHNGTAQISNCHVVNTYTAQGSKNNTASLFVNNDQQVGYTLADNTTSVELFNSLKDMDPLRNTLFVNTSADGTEVLDHYFEYMLETYKGHIVLSSNAIAAKLTSADGLANYQSIYQQAERLETVLPTNIDLSAPKYTMYPMCPLTTIPAGITVDMMGEEIQVLNKIPFVKEVEEGATLKNVNIIAGEKINNNPDILHLFEPMPLGMICGTNNGTLESCKFSAMGGVPMLGDYGNTTGITDAPDIEPKLIFGLIAGENNGTISNCTSQIGDSQLSTEYNWASGPDVISSGTLLDITAGNIVGINNETGVITDCFAGGTLRVTSDFTTPTATAPVKCGHICGVNSNTEDALTNTYYCTSTDFSSEAFTGAYNSDGARQEDKESRGADGTRVYVYSEGGDVSGAVYCNKEEFINYFSNPGKWLINTSTSSYPPPYPDLTFSDITIEIPEGDNQPLNITIESQEDVETLTDYFTNMPSMFSNANITFTQNIVMEEQTLESNDDFENITNYFEGIGSTDIPFTGTLKGENEDGEGIEIVNFTANLNGNCIFNNIDKNATVEGITFTNAQVYATKTMEVEVDTDTEGNKTATTKTVLPIFNDVNKGTIKNCGFSGKVVTADYIDATTEICLIGENNGTIEKCLFVIDFDEPAEPASLEGNKSCIVLKQNIGIGRNTGTVKKVAINKPKSSSNTNSTNKSTIINHSQFSEAEINSDTRYYTDEELASGEAAYWMNFDGQGYSDNYSPIWKMGLKQPILARKGAQDAVYKLDIATDQTSSAISGPMFANAGEDVTVSYSGSPKQILLNNTTIPSSHYGAGTLTFTMPQPSVLGKGNVLLDVLYSATPVKGISCGLSVSAEGSSIAIAGADADMACIYNTAGKMVAQVALADGCGMASVANKGIYIVKAGSQTAKVMVR